MNLPAHWSQEVNGATLTSMKVGGPVRYLAGPRNADELQETFRAINRLGIPWRTLGGGSDLLLPDEGFPGVLVQPKFTEIREWSLEEVEALGIAGDHREVAARYSPETADRFLRLEGHETDTKKNGFRFLSMGAGVPWGQAVVTSLKANAGGFHFFARIPGHVGGAVYNNIHGGKEFLSDYIHAIFCFDPETGQRHVLSQAEAEFGYDDSIFHRRPLVITEALFRLNAVSSEEAAELQSRYLSWTKEKARVQPSGANAGSVFKNLSSREVELAGTGSPSAAWYSDQCGLRRYAEGGMQVYPGHANFIVNTGSGTQADFIRLVMHVRATVWKRFGIVLHPEVECLQPDGNLLAWPDPK